MFGDVDPGHRGDHYTDQDLGDRCATCGMRMVKALVEREGHATHPTCPDPVEQPKRRRRRKGRG